MILSPNSSKLKETVKSIKSVILSARRILIAGHVSPDPDSIGACEAFRLLLRRFGKTAKIVSTTGVKDQWQRVIGRHFRTTASTPKNSDLLIVLDCADVSRIDADTKAFKGTILNIDHHVSNTMFGDINLVANTTSTCELLYTVFELLDPSMAWEPACAKPLAVGILFDTAQFSVVGVGPNTFQTMARLSRWVVMPELVRSLSQMSETSVLSFCKSFLNRRSLLGGRILVVKASSNDNAEWYTSFLRNVSDYDIICVVKLKGDGYLSCSLRSKKANVNALASLFGGGGHKHAAAFRFKGSYSRFLKEFENVVKQQFQKISN
ncbi:MAG: DHH family phosphoesterase [Thermoplasmatales archaeon]